MATSSSIFFFKLVFLFIAHKYPDVELLDQMVIICFSSVQFTCLKLQRTK